MPETERLVRLTPTVSLHIRRDGALQFGIDSTWAGIIDTLPPDTTERVRSILAAARTPVTVDALTAGLVNADVAPAATATLIDELLDYGILMPASSGTPRIGVLGEDRVADGIRELIASHEAEVSGRLPGERPGGFLRTFSPGSPVVITGAPDELHDLSGLILQRGGDVLPVTVIDGRVVLGPIRRQGEGPCPLCARLHRFDADPDSPREAPQFGDGSWLPPDPVVFHTAVTAASALALRLAGVTAPPPGPGRDLPPAGTVITVDPHRLTTTGTRFGVHPHCPDCWAAAQG
ncbi:TOMM precursor leader peptide-binding protein [Corynebacterium sp. CCM 9185]|uniref:TOMM leader peptide-binding protein n=1 Tax=Corynebacterium marambiense TaxID=2765364 RepID=A0ABS0W173_9CORY|nr:TOMM precursor leader peptide-binding protein [Corynebacterium marambiense]MBI9001625.1 TOMM precursor leader peptide-binding protein [Corynebacterium marambiense]MCK7662090.1 TOMM precursor leader peptide-binding protein [Corynebacterium marambiense]MCX7541359.1 TOMM precursor leader peptide-binding protein [Corynebacterium marambiense]